MTRPPKSIDLFDRALLEYAHNFLLLPHRERSRDLDGNPLVLKLLGLRGPPKQVKIADAIRKYAARASLRPISEPKEPIASNLQHLRELLKLDEIDLALLQLGLAISDSRSLREVAVVGTRHISFSSFARVVGIITGHGASEVASRAGSKGRLVRCGLIEAVVCGDLDDRLKPKDGLLDLLAAPGLTRARLLEQFLPNVAIGELPWLDHCHLEQEISVARALLSSALTQRATGVNVLLYGDTGTGKTELAKSLARELGVPLYAARGSDDTGITTPGERISSLLLGLRIVESGGAMVLFDELEDLFERSLARVVHGHIGAVTAKDTFNRLFEENLAPVIWTTNHVRNVDPAFLRRFTHAIEVRPGGIRQRARVLKHSMELPTDQAHPQLDRLAERYEVSPAQAANAVRAARLMGDVTGDQLAPLLAGTCQLVTGRRVRAAASQPEAYLVDAINASVDLEALAERLAPWRPTSAPGVTMCLFGPPGTGKTEYVRYLARRLGRTVLVKRASDILGCYVGETEQKIAAAFDQALTDDAILVFDEVDSLLHDRRDAVRSWEVTQVNEMLQQLEVFQGIVACTTNRWEGLDPAVLRRFTFKIELRPPTVDQAVRLFWAMFESLLGEGCSAASDAALRAALATRRPTPGDLAAVRRRITALGTRPGINELLDEIRAEVGAKDTRARGFIGSETKGS